MDSGLAPRGAPRNDGEMDCFAALAMTALALTAAI
jgi:hypothetical protein